MGFMPDAAFEVNEPMVISETIDGETVIINLNTGSYSLMSGQKANRFNWLDICEVSHLRSLPASA